MKKIYPPKLKQGDTVAVIAPSCSLGIISQELRAIANKNFEALGLKLVFSKYAEELDEFRSSRVQSRVDDLHEAFRDKSVNAIFAVIGGFNSNQLLRYIDWDLIQKNPKIFCGYSDTSALNNAILAKTGLVTYSGPAYSTLGQKKYLEYIIEYLKKCLFENSPFSVEPAEFWTDDEKWFIDQDNRELIKNNGPVVINEGEAQGTIMCANLCTFNLLQGTEYIPDVEDPILFIEDDEAANPHLLDRDLQSTIHQPWFPRVRGIVIGRFQKKSKIDIATITKIIKTKKELATMPIIVDADFGHTFPMFTFPIGGTASIKTANGISEIKILEH
jgi:muramoyltetrapeptide carboxypeptidase LdcA involved in peptidoglycan recycling